MKKVTKRSNINAVTIWGSGVWPFLSSHYFIWWIFEKISEHYIIHFSDSAFLNPPCLWPVTHMWKMRYLILRHQRTLACMRRCQSYRVIWVYDVSFVDFETNLFLSTGHGCIQQMRLLRCKHNISSPTTLLAVSCIYFLCTFFLFDVRFACYLHFSSWVSALASRFFWTKIRRLQ